MKNHEEAKRVFALIQSFNSVDTKKYKNLFLNMSIWRFPEMNRGTPKSPFLIGLSMIYLPFWVPP